MTAWRRRLEMAGLGGRADDLMRVTRPGLRLSAELDHPDPESARTRIGGRPELPDTVAWPRYAAGPLSLVAQVDLAQVAPFGLGSILPPAGLLLFFYDAVEQPWGFDPADRGSSAVLHVPAGVATSRREPPSDLEAAGRHPALALRPTAVEPMPAPYDSSDLDSLGLEREEETAYGDLLDEVLGDQDDDDADHRLLGQPLPIQGDMQLECQLVSHGLFCGDASGYHDERAAGLGPGATDWRLLLQVDSQDEAGMTWGDVGRLYYWIRGADLAAGAWERSWLVQQCY